MNIQSLLSLSPKSVSICLPHKIFVYEELSNGTQTLPLFEKVLFKKL